MPPNDGAPAQDDRWDGILRRHVDIEVRAVNEEERSIEFIASTEALDTYGTILDASWDLKRAKKYCPFLWKHNDFGYHDGARPEDFIPIGRCDTLKVEDRQLAGKAYFATAAVTPLAEQLFQGFREKVIRGVSVGFRAGRVTEEPDPKTGKTIYRLSKLELLEISAVPLPSNPEALARMAGIENEFLRRSVERAEPPNEERNMDENQRLKDELAVARRDATTATERATTAEQALTAERAVNTKLTADLDAANKRLAEADARHAKSELDRLQGRKFAPSERADLEGMVAAAGLERVVAYLEKRADLAVTTRVDLGGGQRPGDIQNAPAPVEGGDDPSADVLREADQAASRAA